jgi:hypothetical protein
VETPLTQHARKLGDLVDPTGPLRAVVHLLQRDDVGVDAP